LLLLLPLATRGFPAQPLVLDCTYNEEDEANGNAAS
jgi:hypothetical protein